VKQSDRHQATFKTNALIIALMKIEICGNIIDSKRVAVQTGQQQKNVERTYIKNEYGIDKSKMLEVMGYGSICTEQKVTPKEMLQMIIFLKNSRELNE